MSSAVAPSEDDGSLPLAGGQVLEGYIERVLESLAALLVALEMVLLLTSVFARYVLNQPITWADELASILFLWLATFGAIIALRRGEHLRLTFFVARLHEPWRDRLEAFTLSLTTLFAAAIIAPAFDYVVDEAIVTLPGLGISAVWRTSAMLVGAVLLTVVGISALARRGNRRDVVAGILIALSLAALLWSLRPSIVALGQLNLFLFFVVAVFLGIAAGLPIAFTFGLATLAYLANATHVPLTVVISRMEDGMSGLILLSVPIFVLLGCVLDATGMGKAIVDVLASLFGHVKAGMSYVLLGSLFVVSGISGSKVSDMATVAPALFPEAAPRASAA